MKHTLYVVEAIRANGEVLADHAHWYLFDAIDEADAMSVEDRCCALNTADDSFLEACPGKCKVRTPKIVTYTATRNEQ